MRRPGLHPTHLHSPCLMMLLSKAWRWLHSSHLYFLRFMEQFLNCKRRPLRLKGMSRQIRGQPHTGNELTG